MVIWMVRQERPYHDDSTASRLLSKVKHRRARLVLRWGTTLESRVLFFCIFISFYPLMEDSTFLQNLFTKKSMVSGTSYTHQTNERHTTQFILIYRPYDGVNPLTSMDLWHFITLSKINLFGTFLVQNKSK